MTRSNPVSMKMCTLAVAGEPGPTDTSDHWCCEVRLTMLGEEQFFALAYVTVMKSLCLARLGLLLASLAGCGDGDGITAPPRPGTVEIVTSTAT
jgi:hypothetical protein